MGRASETKRDDDLSHGLSADSVHLVRLPISDHKALKPSQRTNTDRSCQLRFLFAGRMVFEKGGELLIKALPRVASLLGRSVQLEFVGDGYARIAWQKLANTIAQQNSSVRIIFHPWLESADLAAAFDSTDLLVVPSVWPEPFGMIGREAGLPSVPGADFAAGGTREWLHEGVNGPLAAAHPAVPNGLAAAIADCVRDEAHYSLLREGAYRIASQFASRDHLTPLLKILSAAFLTSPDLSVA